VIVSSYSFIDASTGDYQEEEVFYQEEEGEHFDHLTNQGKLTLLQGSLVQSSTRARHHYILLYEPIPSFYFTSFTGFYLSKLLFEL
jgi:hypothetical protein